MDQADKPAQFASSEQPRTGSQRTLNHQTHSWPLPARVLVCALLAAATFLTFFPVLSSGFVNLDDGEYVTDNPHVATGLRPENIVWAFTTGHASNWHPLTWLSHMVDVQLFGMRPGWHHGVNLLLHITNSVIVLLLLFRLTRAPWPSFITAGLFALHPLHVESVAWISERKDVLSTLFFLLTIWFYAKYTTARQGADTIGNDASASGQPNVLTRDWRRYYSLALLLFALGLMSKPMVVTLPFVLLLLDYWPLGRLAGDGVTKWLALLKEKLPFLAMALVSCVITIVVQARAHSVKFFLPLSLRLENAVVSCILYLSKTVWPVRLAVFYPHPNTRYNLPAIDASHPASEQWPIWSVSLAALALLAGSLALLKWRRRMPWAFVGWCWFLGTLVPVIGIIQVGIQAMADRYTYIPSIGLFAAIVWSAAHWSGASAIGRKLNTGATALILAACGLVAHTQAGYWHDDFTLFKHALNVTTNNAMAECHVGIGLAKQGRLDLAEEHFKAALLDDPFFYMAHSSLGTVYEVQTRFDEAVQQYQAVLKIRPWDDFARVRLAGVLHKLGRDNEAVAEYKRDLGENPDSIDANYELGSLLLDRGDLDSAGVYLSKTVDLKPNHVDALLCLSDVRARQGKLAAAEDALRAVVKIYPANAELRINLASLLWQAGQKTEALQQYTEAVRLQPAEPIGHYDLAIAYASSGNISDAIRELGKALQLKHDYTEALSELAWLLSTSPRAEERNGPQALTLARRALELGATNQPRAWAALDVASAENGQFAEAIKAAQKARDLALSQGQTNAAQIAEQRLQLYSSGKPFHLQ